MSGTPWPVRQDDIKNIDLSSPSLSEWDTLFLELAMDETTKAVIDRITITYPSVQRIPTGQESTIFYDCSRLTPNELARLAAEATGHLPEDTFDVAVGLAYQGILFAAAVAGGREVAILQTDGKVYGPTLTGKRVVLVDDVVHTGRRMRAAAKALTEIGVAVAGFACIVDRSDGAFQQSGETLWSAFQTGML